MLAQNFKAANELGITVAERIALIHMLNMLERGEFIHVEFETADVEFGFNMADFQNDCGTVCCIAGWSDKLYGTRFAGQWSPDDLEDLFLVPELRGSGKPIDDVTVPQAAQALRNYLTTGKPNWNEVLGLTEV